MEKAEKPTSAFIISLIGGIFILLGGIAMSLFAFWASGLTMSMSWMMGRAIMPMSAPFHMMAFLGLVGVASGIIVIVSSALLNSRPEEHVTLGILILIFSIVSLAGALGGFLVGTILGIVGGALAIAWKEG